MFLAFHAKNLKPVTGPKLILTPHILIINVKIVHFTLYCLWELILLFAFII